MFLQKGADRDCLAGAVIWLALVQFGRICCLLVLLNLCIRIPLPLLGPVLVAIILNLLFLLLLFLLFVGSISVSLALLGPVLVMIILLPAATRLAARILSS